MTGRKTLKSVSSDTFQEQNGGRLKYFYFDQWARIFSPPWSNVLSVGIPLKGFLMLYREINGGHGWNIVRMGGKCMWAVV